jgi:hypothetical protein
MPRSGDNATCDCPCHTGNVVVHPEPCCVPCPCCGVRVPARSGDHQCQPFGTRAADGVRRRRLVATGYRLAPLLMVLLVMALAVWSVPYPACLIFVVVGLLGAGIAVWRVRHATPAAPHVVGPPANEDKT